MHFFQTPAGGRFVKEQTKSTNRKGKKAKEAQKQPATHTRRVFLRHLLFRDTEKAPLAKIRSPLSRVFRTFPLVHRERKCRHHRRRITWRWRLWGRRALLREIKRANKFDNKRRKRNGGRDFWKSSRSSLCASEDSPHTTCVFFTLSIISYLKLTLLKRSSWWVTRCISSRGWT